jgi:phosphohistidine phosphatase
MMKLYIVQHGISLSEEVDPEKSLSPEGEEQSRKIAEFLKEKSVQFDAIWHSPKKRAVQTAHILSETAASPEIQERKDLNPLDPVGPVRELIEPLKKNLMIVGHLPFLQKLVSFLLSEAEDNQFISIKNSGVICLEHTDSWRILWAVTPGLLDKQKDEAGFDSSKFGC